MLSSSSFWAKFRRFIRAKSRNARFGQMLGFSMVTWKDFNNSASSRGIFSSVRSMIRHSERPPSTSSRTWCGISILSASLRAVTKSFSGFFAIAQNDESYVARISIFGFFARRFLVFYASKKECNSSESCNQVIFLQSSPSVQEITCSILSISASRSWGKSSGLLECCGIWSVYRSCR